MSDTMSSTASNVSNSFDPNVTASRFDGCPFCSGPYTTVIHTGRCPYIVAVEYYSNGRIKRVEYIGVSPGAKSLRL